MKSSLKLKLLVPTLAMVLIGMSISTFVSYRGAYNALEKVVNDQMGQLAASTSSSIGEWIKRNRLDLANWSKQEIIVSSAPDTEVGRAFRVGASDLMTAWVKEYDFYEIIALVDAKGDIIAASDIQAIGKINMADREYFKQTIKGESATSEVTRSKTSGNPVFIISVPVRDADKTVIGILLGAVSLSGFAHNHVDTIKVGDTGHAYIVNNQGLIIAHPDKQQVLATDISKSDFGRAMLEQQKGVLRYTDQTVDKLSAFIKEPTIGWFTVVTAPVYEVMACADQMRNVLTIIGLAVAVFLGIGLWLLMNAIIIKPVLSVSAFADQLQQGDLSAELKTGSDELGRMGAALNAVVRELKAKAEIAAAIADGDLQQQVIVTSEQDTFGKALDTMVQSLNKTVSQLREAAEQVDAGSRQISDSSQSLSQGATEQAASLEEITSSMTLIGSQTKTNADNAGQASQLAEEVRDTTTSGLARMHAMVTAMEAINNSSRDIFKIIKTIDDIAFQTNLLALNAAVEAARAGKHGKGFAVVAQEVRNLASRSAKAAQETAQLIEGAVRQVKEGNTIAETTEKALQKIAEGIVRVTDLVSEIAVASKEQAQGVSQVNLGLSQIDNVTQQNTANAEETSAAAEELSSQATQVKMLLSVFHLQQKKLPAVKAIVRRKDSQDEPLGGKTERLDWMNRNL